MEKNETMVLQCSSLGTNGEGIVKTEGTTVFVPYMLPGERGEVKILKVKGNVGYGKLGEIFTPAEERVRPVCPVFRRCGGCQLQHMNYRAQARFKEKLVKDTLLKIAGLDVPVGRIEPSEKRFAYRNKLQLPIGRADGENAIGFYAERSHRIVPTEVCPIHPEWAEKLIAALRRFMEKCGLDGYDEETGEGQLRHIVVRELKKKYIVTLVANVREIPGIDFFLFLLDDIFPEYSFYLNINEGHTNVVFGEEFLLLKGPGRYECTEAGVIYEAGANTFVQVNEDIRGKLYEAAAELVEEGETVIDCYAGGGLLTAMLAKKSGKAYGIEIVPEASMCADLLCARNGLGDRMENICGAVERELPSLLKKLGGKIAVVLDPPRSGADRSVLKELLRGLPSKIVMISCNPATLARDLGILTGSLKETEGGELVRSEPDSPYEISLVRPFDMFPQTKHVETLVVLSHKKPDGHIGVKVEFGEGEGQISLKEVEKRAEERKPKEKITYKMIQEYIEKTYGFKVHTAYIAEVKRDLGLPMYDAPNAVEELKRPRSHPSPQMVEAIKETLKHFEII